MSTFSVDREKITAFELDGTYLFKQYFDQDNVFAALRSYYNKDKYRFEVPEDNLDEVRQIIDDYFYDLRIENDLRSYCVVKQKDSNYSNILKNSVLTKRRSDHIIFLMKDQLSVEQAIEHGATPLSETHIHVEL
jgi:uncharacterized protein YkuJ